MNGAWLPWEVRSLELVGSANSYKYTGGPSVFVSEVEEEFEVVLEAEGWGVEANKAVCSTGATYAKWPYACSNRMNWAPSPFLVSLYLLPWFEIGSG